MANPPRFMSPFLAQASGGSELLHGFFTSEGGCSVSPYQSLNGSLAVGDDPAHVAANRAACVCALFGESVSLILPRQVHGGNVMIATAENTQDAIGCDAVVTTQPGVAIGVLTADCAPVLLAAPHRTAGWLVAAVHAGWRGAARGVIEAAWQAMIDLGAARDQTIAAIGPTIAAASYEVGDDLHTAVIQESPAMDKPAACFFHQPKGPNNAQTGRFYFDLPGYVRARLAQLGATVIDDLAVDTHADLRCFSHRRAGGSPTGRMLSLIGWRAV
ncbi:MAG: polyphenol oxidase family protein [Pseudomonadota bacterium]